MLIVQNFRRLEKLLSRRNMDPAISLIFTIMRLCAHMHSQSEHLFVKSITARVFLHNMKQSDCLMKISFTCFKTCNAITSGLRFCGTISIFSVLSAVHLSVNFFLVIASPPRPLVVFFETCPRCSPRSLVVSARKWQPSLIFTFIASPSKPLEEFCRNLTYEFLSMSRCVRPKMILVCQKKKK